MSAILTFHQHTAVYYYRVSHNLLLEYWISLFAVDLSAGMEQISTLHATMPAEVAALQFIIRACNHAEQSYVRICPQSGGPALDFSANHARSGFIGIISCSGS